jgi:hypothetical protein
MGLHAQFVLEMAKQLPRGFASASDHLRVEIVHRFGGLYSDGDNSFAPPEDERDRDPECFTETLPEFFDRIARSLPGFTMNPTAEGKVAVDMVTAPARHPAIALWRECARMNYFWNQPDMFGALRLMAMPYVGHHWQEHRYMTAHRSGRIHYQVLALLGMGHESLPPTRSVVRQGREWSWLPPAGGEPVAVTRGLAARGVDEVVAVLARCVTFLQWQLVARVGDLYLSAVAPVIRGLPDPEAAWIALLRVLPAVSRGLPAVASVTDLRRNDGGRLEAVRLPPQAEALLARAPVAAGWLGAAVSDGGRPVWLLDERVTPARLAGAGRPGTYLAGLLPFAEVSLNRVGQPVGVWLRPAEEADRHRRHILAAPAQRPWRFTVTLGTDRADSLAQVPAHPEAIARLLADLQVTGQPIRLVVPPGAGAEATGLAEELRGLLDQPVGRTETPPAHTGHSLHPPLALTTHLPLDQYLNASRRSA